MVIHEIEQKFGILTQLLPRFRSNLGSPPFYPSGRSHVECKKASANGGDLPFYSSEALVDCVEALVQVDRVAVFNS
jgi:hypothetical protein